MNNSHSQPVVVRFPPSPTGLMHVGTARTMLFNYLFAKQHNGKIVMRIEDTDTVRSKKEYEDDIVSGLTWLGFSYDEFYRQSERAPIYRTHLEALIASGAAYISKEIPKEPTDHDSVIRLKNQNKVVTFNDKVRGDISVDTTDLGDFIIAKSLDEALYHFAVVVDDFTMGITHVIRGEDHISNTPRQILIQEALGAPRPIYAHVPLMLGADRSKLSKRKHPELVSITGYRTKGYMQTAFVNFLALVGWNPGTPQEIFSMDELITAFNLEQIQKGGAIFNIEKLQWLNREYLKKESDAYFVQALITHLPQLSVDMQHKLVPTIRERIMVLADIKDMATNGEFSYLIDEPTITKEKLLWKDTPAETIAAHLTTSQQLLTAVPENTWTTDVIKATLWPHAEKEGKGLVLWPIRYALTGKDQSPDPFTVAALLGKTATLQRISTALGFLS